MKKIVLLIMLSTVFAFANETVTVKEKTESRKVREVRKVDESTVERPKVREVSRKSVEIPKVRVVQSRSVKVRETRKSREVRKIDYRETSSRVARTPREARLETNR